MRKLSVLVLVCLFFISCASLPVWMRPLSVTRQLERETYLQNNPGISQSVKTAIAFGEVRIGMTREQVLMSRGKPYDVNRSTGSYGVHEQWVMVTYGLYGSSGIDKRARIYAYIYFENGRVTGWQSR